MSDKALQQKPAVLEAQAKYKGKLDHLEGQLTKASGFAFYNTSRYDFEKLSADPNTRAALARALGSKLNRAVTLDVRVEGAAASAQPAPSSPPRRFTPEQVKTDKLARMAREEPVLGKAVEEWNLELLD